MHPHPSTKVPSHPDWLHEIKYDGYRLIVVRDGDRVKLLTRNGYDWSNRYPWIVESALRNRQRQFVIDGEAVILGVDGRSDFDALHSGQQDEQVQFYAFDMLAGDGDDMRSLPLSLRKSNLARLVARDLMASLSHRSNPARSAPIYSEPRVRWDSRAWYRSPGIALTELDGHRIGCERGDDQGEGSRMSTSREEWRTRGRKDMDDRISEILQNYLNLARNQLDLLNDGVRVKPNLGLPVTEQELLVRIENLQAALQRHEKQKAGRR